MCVHYFVVKSNNRLFLMCLTTFIFSPLDLITYTYNVNNKRENARGRKVMKERMTALNDDRLNDTYVKMLNKAE